jgi:hypothetical protein
VRHIWIQNIDVEKLAKDLRSSFEVVSLNRAEPELMSIVGRETREKFLAKGDTLQVYLSPIKATLFQKKKKPFTQNDLRLRERIFAVYPHSRSTPFPWSFMQEPRFEVEDTRK